MPIERSTTYLTIGIELLYLKACACYNTPVLAFKSNLFVAGTQGLPLKCKSETPTSLGGPVETVFANGRQKTAGNSLLQRTAFIAIVETYINSGP